MKRILVASDLSARSERALRRAFLLAEAHDARLTVVSVVDGDLPPGPAGKLKEAAEEDLARLCRSISARGHEVKIDIAQPVEAICQAADDIAADLIVLGVHRQRPFWDMFSGTTMERVVRATRRTVLVVTDAADHAYSRVLCGIDLSPSCAAAAQSAAVLAPGATFSTFHAVHIPYRGFVAPDPSSRALQGFLDEAQAEIDAWWPTANLPPAIPKPRPIAASVVQAFEAARTAFDPDLVVVGAHGRPGLAPTLLGAFTEQLLRDPPCDILLERR